MKFQKANVFSHVCLPVAQGEGSLYSAVATVADGAHSTGMYSCMRMLTG